MTKATYINVRRIVREDVTIKLEPGETPYDAQQRAIATQDALPWFCYASEYDYDEPYEAEEPPAPPPERYPPGSPGIPFDEPIFAAGGLKVRHDAHGYYLLTPEEAQWEDESDYCYGHDGRDHYETKSDALHAAADLAGVECEPTGMEEG